MDTFVYDFSMLKQCSITKLKHRNGRGVARKNAFGGSVTSTFVGKIPDTCECRLFKRKTYESCLSVDHYIAFKQLFGNHFACASIYTSREINFERQHVIPICCATSWLFVDWSAIQYLSQCINSEEEDGEYRDYDDEPEYGDGGDAPSRRRRNRIRPSVASSATAQNSNADKLRDILFRTKNVVFDATDVMRQVDRVADAKLVNKVLDRLHSISASSHIVQLNFGTAIATAADRRRPDGDHRRQHRNREEDVSADAVDNVMRAILVGDEDLRPCHDHMKIYGHVHGRAVEWLSEYVDENDLCYNTFTLFDASPLGDLLTVAAQCSRFIRIVHNDTVAGSSKQETSSVRSTSSATGRCLSISARRAYVKNHLKQFEKQRKLPPVKSSSCSSAFASRVIGDTILLHVVQDDATPALTCDELISFLECYDDGRSILPSEGNHFYCNETPRQIGDYKRFESFAKRFTTIDWMPAFAYVNTSDDIIARWTSCDAECKSPSSSSDASDHAPKSSSDNGNIVLLKSKNGLLSRRSKKASALTHFNFTSSFNLCRYLRGRALDSRVDGSCIRSIFFSTSNIFSKRKPTEDSNGDSGNVFDWNNDEERFISVTEFTVDLSQICNSNNDNALLHQEFESIERAVCFTRPKSLTIRGSANHTCEILRRVSATPESASGVNNLTINVCAAVSRSPYFDGGREESLLAFLDFDDDDDEDGERSTEQAGESEGEGEHHSRRGRRHRRRIDNYWSLESLFINVNKLNDLGRYPTNALKILQKYVRASGTVKCVIVNVAKECVSTVDIECHRDCIHILYHLQRLCDIKRVHFLCPLLPSNYIICLDAAARCANPCFPLNDRHESFLNQPTVDKYAEYHREIFCVCPHDGNNYSQRDSGNVAEDGSAVCEYEYVPE